MSNFNDYVSRLLAGFGAVAMTVTLLASYFSTPQSGVITSLIA